LEETEAKARLLKVMQPWRYYSERELIRLTGMRRPTQRACADLLQEGVLESNHDGWMLKGPDKAPTPAGRFMNRVKR
jgi:hypothetical protein